MQLLCVVMSPVYSSEMAVEPGIAAILGAEDYAEPRRAGVLGIFSSLKLTNLIMCP